MEDSIYPRHMKPFNQKTDFNTTVCQALSYLKGKNTHEQPQDTLNKKEVEDSVAKTFDNTSDFPTFTISIYKLPSLHRAKK